MPDAGLRPVRRALISVSDKTGLDPLLERLACHRVALLSTGGTADFIRARGFPVEEVTALTGFPPIMGGRVKTLHPAVYGGILGVRGDAAHEAERQAHGIAPIDMVVVNLYPFADAVKAGKSREECLEMIDIGGPAMLRAGAKNYRDVLVVSAPGDYPMLLQALSQGDGATPCALRRCLAQKAFERVAEYDQRIAEYFSAEPGGTGRYTLTGVPVRRLRYGENPHQSAALYRTAEVRAGLVGAQQIQGKALSYNNIADGDAAFELVAEFDPKDAPACAIIKHASPCGVARASSSLEAWKAALRTDPDSAFGGVVAFNGAIDAPAAAAMASLFIELVVAPDASGEARAIFAKKSGLRLLLTGALPDPRAPGERVRQVAGGFLVQEADRLLLDEGRLEVVSARKPTEREMADMQFAWSVARHTASNAIVLAKDGATTGIGAGQANRRDAVLDAVRRARRFMPDALSGCAVASDAFFPFPDGLVAAAEAGATAVIQPGGAIRDDAIIAEADKRNLAMVFTNLRHFRH